MKSKTKLIAANVACVLIIIFVWTLFLTPILVIAYAYLKYFNYPTLDLSANSTIADVFDEEACPNQTLENAIASIRAVANGNYSDNFTCTEPFTSNGTQCVPECLAWHPGGEPYRILYRYTVPVLSLISTLTGLFGASTWLFLKRLWKFPHIISLYLLITVIGQGLVIFIGSLAPKEFYCTNSDLFISRLVPTIPCHIQGALFQFFILTFLLWYICDVFNILYVMLFPHRALGFFKHQNKIHLTQAIISWGIPFIIVVLIGAIQGYEITSAPLFCLPSIYITLFSFFFPGIVFSLLTQTSFTILGTILYKRHVKVTSLSSNNEYLERLRQIILFSTSFSILTILILINYACLAIGLREVEQYLTDYLHCITVFDQNTACCKQIYIDYYYPLTGFLSDSAFCTWAIIGVIAVGVKEAKNIWKRGVKQCIDRVQTMTYSRTSKIESTIN